MPDCINIEQLRGKALLRLPRVVSDYLEGGAEDEASIAANRTAFARISFVPRLAGGQRAVDLSVTLFGRSIKTPFIVGPTGMNGIFWRDGDVCLARAAAQRGSAF